MLKWGMVPLVAAAALGLATAVQAADLYEPPVVVPPPPQIIEKPVAIGGWYLRGDINYHWADLRGTEYITYGCPGCAPDPDTDDFDSTDLKGALSIGGGVGYQITRYLRTDFTADYWFDADFRGTTTGVSCTPGGGPCSSVDTSAFSALLLMANAYVDLGTYHGVTPYVGAGIGGAYVQWDDLVNDATTGLVVHEGASNWRFAWALMAGASYCLTENLQLDAGYRFTRIEGGRMFEESGLGVGPGFDDGFNVHEVRAGLRYALGGPSLHCSVPRVVAYDPPPYEPPYEPPIYK
jgi:Opacity protein and related surface antigens